MRFTGAHFVAATGGHIAAAAARIRGHGSGVHHREHAHHLLLVTHGGQGGRVALLLLIFVNFGIACRMMLLRA